MMLMFLTGKGFREETLKLLTSDNIRRLAMEQGFFKAPGRR